MHHRDGGRTQPSCWKSTQPVFHRPTGACHIIPPSRICATSRTVHDRLSIVGELTPVYGIAAQTTYTVRSPVGPPSLR